MKKLLLISICFWWLLAACASDGLSGVRTESVPNPSADETPSSSFPAPAGHEDLNSATILYTYENAQLFHPIDPTTGQVIAGYEALELGLSSPHTLPMPELGLMAVVDYGAGRLFLIDLAAWAVTETELRFPRVMSKAYDAAGRRMALTYFNLEDEPMLAVIDLATTTVAAETALDLWPRHQLYFTPDGGALVLYGEGRDGETGTNQARVALFDAGALTRRWALTLAEVAEGMNCDNCLEDPDGGMSFMPGLALAPDGSALYVAHADADRLTTVDLKRGVARTVDVSRPVSLLESLFSWATVDAVYAKAINSASKSAVISPDGRLLYIVGSELHYEEVDGQLAESETYLGLQVVEAASGRIVATFETEATSLELLPDARHLALLKWTEDGPESVILNRESLAVEASLEGLWLRPSSRLDGRPLLLAESNEPAATRTTLALLDPETFDVLNVWEVDAYASWIMTR